MMILKDNDDYKIFIHRNGHVKEDLMRKIAAFVQLFYYFTSHDEVGYDCKN